MPDFTVHVRDLLTDQDLPLRPDEWVARRVVRDDGSLLVELFGPHTQQQALDILAENLPTVSAEPFGDSFIIVREV